MSSASPTPYKMSRASSHVSSIPTSPPVSNNEEDNEKETGAMTGDDEEWQEDKEDKVKDLPQISASSRFALLDDLLRKSALYTEKIGERMLIEQRRQEKLNKRNAQAKAGAADIDEDEGAEVKKGKKRTKNSKGSNNRRKRVKTEEPTPEPERPLGQPVEITGATLRDYQLQGVAWMAGLYQHNMNGILADEMGLGKTLQTISFLAHLREQCVSKPFLIVCPLSVLHNWIEEFSKFAPSIPVCMYHGTPTERAALRKSQFAPLYRQAKEAKEYNKALMKKYLEEEKARAARRATGQESDDEDEHEARQREEIDEEHRAKVMKMPVIVTTYEMIIKDAKFLSHLDWGYIIVDEGHRLKNFEGKLITEIKKYDSANRLILTGTPLHNNLAELWSLLNFILPDLFTDLDSFQEWFNLSTVTSSDNAPAISERKSQEIVTKLHAILKPFLLRRIKADVETGLPPKKEFVLYTPLSDLQREAYQAVLEGSMRGYLLAKEEEETMRRGIGKFGKGAREKVDVNAPRKTRNKAGKKVRYNVDEDDEAYFEKLEAGEVEDYRETRKEKNVHARDLGNDYLRKLSVKKVNSLKLQNTVMQLRKVCSHPYLFDWPLDQDTHEPIVDEQLVNASGKMMVLERLLDELFKRGHKVLLFSQFTTMLDIIEEWAESFKGWNICRIDGSTAPSERREQMNLFQASLFPSSPNAAKSPSLFLLSTRAGGLGINLTAADTVIFFDNDWNPQMDLQAQDRAHRIGQKRNVLVVRLVSANTIESKILSKASERRRLEQLVIAKGKFKAPGQKSQTHAQALADMHDTFALKESAIEVVPSTEAGKANVIGNDVLESLLDRNWDNEEADSKKAAAVGAAAGKSKATFAVFEATAADAEGGGSNLAKLFGEDIQ